MDMDTDWCLTCNRRVDGSNLYCSFDCQYGAGPSTSHRHSLASLSQEPHSSYDEQLDEGQDYEGEVYDDACGDDDDDNLDDDDDLQCTHSIEAVSKTNWAGRGSAGIRAWAAEIPLGAHPHLPAIAPSSADDSSSISSASSSSSAHRAPNLVRPSRPLPPSLTMSRPEPPSTTSPRPILSLQKQLNAISNSHSPGSTTRTSIFSEDSLPTPGSINAMPFSTLPRRPFPSISDARAYELAACTKSSPSHNVAARKDNAKYVIRRSKPVVPRIASSSQSSLDDELVSSPPWRVTNSTVAQQVTRAAAKKPVCSSTARKGTHMVSEAARGRRSSRVAA